MSFQTVELTSDQYTDLRGDHTTQWLTILNPNTVVFAARVNQAVFGISFAQITFDTVTTGAYTDALEGFPVYISHTNNIRAAFFTGRVRKDPTSSILYINETSLAVEDNDHIWVIKDPRRLQEKHPHEDESTGEIKFDYDISFRKLRPICRGVEGVYYKILAGGVADFAFAPTWLATESGSSIASYASTLDGGSYQAGSNTSQNFTARYTAAGVYYPRLSATDSGGRTNWFSPMVIVDDADHSICTPDAEVNSIQRLLGEDANATLTLKSGTNMDDVLDNTLVVCVSISNIDPILTNIIFAGRLQDEANQINVNLRSGLSSSVSFRLEGMAAQMGRLILASVAMRRVTASAIFGEVNALTLWRAMVLIFTELVTLSNIAPLGFDNETGDYGVPLLGADTRSAGDSIGDMAFAINAFMKFSPAGEIKIVRHMAYLSSADKATLVNVANFEMQDWTKDMRINREHILRVGRIMAFGGSYNTSAGKVTALRAIAPSRIFSSGAGRSTLNSQVLKVNLSLTQMKEDIALRAGAEYAAKNQQTVLDGTLPSNYEYMVPAPDEVYTWTLPATTTKTGRGFTTADRWYLQSVTLNHDYEKHRTDVQPKWVLDSSNIAAQVFAEVAPDELPWSTPPLLPYPSSPFPMYDSLMYDGEVPDAEDEQPYTPEEIQRATSPGKKNTDPDRKPDPAEQPSVKKGNVVAVANSSGLWVCDNFTRSKSPNWRNITPGTGINAFQWNRFGAGGWCLTDDSADSIVWRTDNILVATPTWNSAMLEDELYTLIAAAGIPGSLYAYAPSGEAIATINDDMTAGLGPNTGEFSATYPFGHQGGGYPGGTWIATEGRGGGGSIEGVYLGPPYQAGAFIDLGSEQVVTAASFWYKTLTATVANEYITFFDAAKVQIDQIVFLGGHSSVYVQRTWSGSVAGVQYVAFTVNSNIDNSYLDDISVSTGTSDQAVTRYSTDNGATFAASEQVGATPGADGGFHARPDSDTALAAADAIVRTADTGGSYSDATGGGTTGSYAKAIFAFGEDGDFLMASAAAVSGETLWKVESGVATAITPNDGSNDGLIIGPGCLCTAPEDSGVIFALMSFGGTRKLARSTNGGTSWAFTSTNIGSGANYVRCKNAEQVYVCNADNLAYSEDGGATFFTKVAPGASLLLLEVR